MVAGILRMFKLRMLGKMHDSLPGRGSRLKRRELSSWEEEIATAAKYAAY